jgi:hypothetical protein
LSARSEILERIKDPLASIGRGAKEIAESLCPALLLPGSFSARRSTKAYRAQRFFFWVPPFP